MGKSSTPSIQFGEIEEIELEFFSNKPSIVDGYWVNEKGEKITCAYLDEKFYFRITTRELTDPKTIHADAMLSVGGFDETFCWSHEKYTPIIENDVWLFEFIFKDKLKSNWRYGNIGKLYTKFEIKDTGKFFNDKYELPKNEEDYLLVTDEVGYLKSDDCRVKIDKLGIIRWIPDNCIFLTRNLYYNYTRDPNNWRIDTRTGFKEQGLDLTRLAEFTYSYEKLPERTDGIQVNIPHNESDKYSTARMNRSRDAVSDDTVLKIGIVNSKSTGRPDQRVKTEKTQRTANPTGGARSAGAGAALAVNLINYALENAPTFSCYYDSGQVEDHYKVLVNNVIPDIINAANSYMIPNKYKDLESFYALCNIVLCGYSENVNTNSELYKVGKKIYKEISKFEKK